MTQANPDVLRGRAIALGLGFLALLTLVSGPLLQLDAQTAAGPPGVPSIQGTAPKDTPEADPPVIPADSPPKPAIAIPEQVAMLVVSDLPPSIQPDFADADTLLASWPAAPKDPANLHLGRHGNWFVLAGSPALIDDFEVWHASRLAEDRPPMSVACRVLELDPTRPETIALIDAVRRDPDGREVAMLMTSPPESAVELAAPVLILNPGSSGRFELVGVNGPSIELELIPTGPDPEGRLELEINARISREKTLGRRTDTRGSRATDRRRTTEIGRPVAITTAPFATTSIRTIDGTRRTLPTAVAQDAPVVLIVAEPRTAASGTDLPRVETGIYRDGPASRDGIGRRYFGRDIAQVMGHFAAGWLERPEREQEERTSLLLSLLPVAEGDTVADIGAGSGYFTRRLSRMVGDDGRVLATDIQPQMLEILQDRLRAEGIGNVRPILGTTSNTGLESGSVDLILLVDVYHEFDLPWEMARSMRHALRPGGRVALVEYRANDPLVPIKPLHTMTAEQSRLEFEAAGFRLDSEFVGELPWQRLQLFARDDDSDR